MENYKQTKAYKELELIIKEDLKNNKLSYLNYYGATPSVEDIIIEKLSDIGFDDGKITFGRILSLLNDLNFNSDKKFNKLNYISKNGKPLP